MFEKYGLVYENEDLKKHTTYKLDIKCKYLVMPDNIDNLIELVKLLNKENIKYFIIGNGSNLIFANNYFDGVIIKLELLKNYNIDEKNLILNTECGAYLPMLSSKLINGGYSGFEWCGGLPGEVGASIYNNAEAYKVPISSNLIDVTIFKNNKIITLKKEDITFGYRTSSFKENKDSIILSARFKLERKDIDSMKELVKDRLKRRLDTQPLEYPSAGSTFRNPHINDYKEIFEKYNLPVNNDGFVPAGYIIESLGLKGKTVGGAMVSEKHANFIINYNNATGDDILKLIELIKHKVKETYEIDLILEQEIVNI